jgi:hypothetical protein
MYKSLRRSDEERATAFAKIDRLRAEQKAELAKSDRQCTMSLVCYLVATILAYNFAPISIAITVLFAPAIGFTLMTGWMLIKSVVDSSQDSLG